MHNFVVSIPQSSRHIFNFETIHHLFKLLNWSACNSIGLLERIGTPPIKYILEDTVEL